VGATLIAASLLSPVAQAETNSEVGTIVTPSEPGGAARIFLNGSSRGEPSTAKLVTLYSVYTLAVGSLAFGGVMLFDHFDDRDATQAYLDDHQNPGPCYELTSRSCARLEQLRSDEQQSRNFAAMGLAGAGTLLLGGLLTAEQWKNTQPTFSASDDGASIHVRFTF
jgi:hypothetical protein